jgi:dihydroflavonol-4-reductase
MSVAVVTGASGHIGANLVRQLLALGRPVRVLCHRDARALAGLEVERVDGDILDRISLDKAFARAEIVYHLAAHISISGGHHGHVDAVNVAGVRNVVDACLEEGVRRLVHFSSIHALCQYPLTEPLDERRGPSDERPAPAYDHSKARGEREVLAGIERGLDAVIVNPTAVLGPYDFKPSRMGQVLHDLCHRRLPALVEGGFDWVDVRDVCAAAIAAERTGVRGERYLLGGTYATVADLAALVAEISGARAPRLVVPQWLARPVAPFAEAWGQLCGREARFSRDSLTALRSCNRTISHARAAAQLSFAPRPLRTTISDTLRWFAETGMLTA